MALQEDCQTCIVGFTACCHVPVNLFLHAIHMTQLSRPSHRVDFVCRWLFGSSVTCLVPEDTPDIQQKKTAAFLVQVRQLVEYVNCGYMIRYWYKYTCYGTK